MTDQATIERSDDVPDDVDLDDVAAAVVRPTVNEWLRARTLPQILLACAVLLWTAYFTKRSLDIHHGLGTSSYDSGLYDQGMWLLSRGEAPFVTLMGRNMFGDHTSFVLLFLVPLYWIAPGAWIMFFSQSAAIAAGAIPVFLYGRRRLESEWFALIAAATYLLHPAVGWANLENFHPDSFLGVFIGVALYGALERKWKLYAAFVVLSLLVKEDVSLVVVPLGIWVALRRDRRIGLITIFGSLWFMFTAMYVVMRGLIGQPTLNAWRIPFSQPGDGTGTAARRLIDTAVTNPTQLADHLRADGRPWYLWQMTSPFAWIFLRLPSVALISALVLFTNILSTFWYQYQVQYHYALVAVPALAIGTVYALGAVRGRFRVLSFEVSLRAVAVAALWLSSSITAVMWSPMPWGRTVLFHGDPDNVYAVTMRDIIEEIPAEASVAAHHRVTPHIAYRTEIYQFPNPFRLTLYGPDRDLEGIRLAERADGVDFLVLPTSEDENVADDFAVIEAAFIEVAANQFWVLYERDRSIPLPGN
jgi:uncharacterized membrane protein